jgi:hypothetical protein
MRSACGQTTVQALPFKVNAAGFAVFPEWLAWNPNDVEPPGGMVAL